MPVPPTRAEERMITQKLDIGAFELKQQLRQGLEDRRLTPIEQNISHQPARRPSRCGKN